LLGRLHENNDISIKLLGKTAQRNLAYQERSLCTVVYTSNGDHAQAVDNGQSVLASGQIRIGIVVGGGRGHFLDPGLSQAFE
jgi:hypothetical protein